MVIDFRKQKKNPEAIMIKDKNRLDEKIRITGSIVGKNQYDQHALYQLLTTNKILEIVKDPTHPLHK